MSKICEQCKTDGLGEVTIIEKEKRDGTGSYFVNADGSYHTVPITRDGKTKWIHVRDKVEAAFVKERGYRPQSSQVEAIKQNENVAKSEFKFQMLNEDQRKIIEKEILTLNEVRKVAEAILQTDNQAAIGQMLNLIIQIRPELFGVKK